MYTRNFCEEDELYHHGVLGMKWGVHRYQNKDGTLTAKGKARFDKVVQNPKLAARQTREVRNSYSKQKANIDALSEGNKNAANRAMKKVDKLVWKSESKQAKGDQKGFDKYQGKAWKQVAKSITKKRNADFLDSTSSFLQRKIDDIDSGKVKAGRDFIVQHDYNFGAVFIPGVNVIAGGGSRTSTLIEKPKNSKTA